MCGVQKKLPHKLLYGPLEARGLGVKDPYWLQLIFHLQAILRHSNRDTPSHDLLNENMELVQAYVGSDQTFWDLPFDMYGHLAPEGWIKNTWKALSETGITLKGPNLAVPTKRVRDVHLMDAFVDQGFDEKKLATLQKCRMFYGADTLADISTACGSRIDQTVWEGRPMPSRERKNWIQVHNPSRNDWVVWRDALRQTFMPPHCNTRLLRNPLGAWKKEEDPDWAWWKCETTNHLYQQTAQGWMRWNRMHTTGSIAKYHHPVPTNHIPTGKLRATVNVHANSNVACVLSTGPILHIPDPPTATSLPEAVADLPSDAKWAIQNLQQTDDGAYIAAAMQANQAIAVSDGSLKKQFGTAAFVLEGATSLNRIRAVNIAPGPLKDGDSHRCEMAGLYGMVALSNCIAALHNVTTGSVRVACDNKHALRIFDEDYIPDVKHPDYDLVSATLQLIQESPLDFYGEHVKGHQDQKVLARPYTRQELLNMEMDDLAKGIWRHIVLDSDDDRLPAPPQHSIHGEGWQLWHGNSKINNPTTDNLYKIIHTPITHDWYRRHNQVSEVVFPLIDWEVTSKVMREIPQPLRMWVTKTASENCGVGSTLVGWKLQDDARCPRCNHPLETTAHATQCTGHGANQVWEESMEKLDSYFESTDTCPRISRALKTALNRWRDQQPQEWMEEDEDIVAALQAQTAIGWQDLLEGLPAKHWRELQELYYIETESRKSSKKWLLGLTKLFIRTGQKQWKHRNDYKHNKGKPRHIEMEERLNQEIGQEYIRGTTTLQPGDRIMLDINLVDLLNRKVEYKQAWLNNVSTARQRHHRIQQNNNNLKTKSRENSAIVHWQRTGRCR